MLTETQIRKATQETLSERSLTAGRYGRGAGVLKLRIQPGTSDLIRQHAPEAMDKWDMWMRSRFTE